MDLRMLSENRFRFRTDALDPFWTRPHSRSQPQALRRRRPTHMKSLDLVNAELSHECHLFLGLDAFDQDLMTAISHEPDNIPEHGLALRGVAIMQERAVYLYRVEIDQPQP